jgi:dUTP pyrophosphatase
MTLQVQVRKLSWDARLPEYATDGSGCFDIFNYSKNKSTERLHIGSSVVCHTGLAFEIPEGHVMLVYSRSGHGFKSNVRLANCVAVIDSDYRGELMIKLNMDDMQGALIAAQDISHGTAIAQGMIIPIPKVKFLEVKELSETARGEGGFGSTDSKQLNWGLTPEQSIQAKGISLSPNNWDDWRKTEAQHIWYSPTLKLFVYSDEASQYDTTGYYNIGDAKDALAAYIKNHLDPKPAPVMDQSRGCYPPL